MLTHGIFETKEGGVLEGIYPQAINKSDLSVVFTGDSCVHGRENNLE